MSTDGVLLMRARERLARQREENERELEERRRRVYAGVPEIKEIDAAERRLLAEVVGAALRERADPDAALREIDEKSLELRARRAELLTENGFGAEYLNDIYGCSKCHDTGYRGGRMCECLRRLYESEQAKDLSSMLDLGECDFSRFDLGYYPEEVDPARGISARECMTLVLGACRSYARSFGSESPNLLLRGGTGLGKTFLSGCIAREVSSRGFSVVYDTASSAFAAFEDQKFARSPEISEPAAQKVTRMLRCDLMILDDLGTEMTTAFTQSALYTLVNTRLTENRKTVISTNLTPEELSARYSAQTVSRIFGEYDQLLFMGRDIRAVKKQRRDGVV